MGEIAGAVFVLGRRALTDVPTWTIFAVTLGVVPLMKKVFEPVLILLAGIAGIAVQRMAT